jgi:hypothetical protein
MIPSADALLASMTRVLPGGLPREQASTRIQGLYRDTLQALSAEDAIRFALAFDAKRHALSRTPVHATVWLTIWSATNPVTLALARDDLSATGASLLVDHARSDLLREMNASRTCATCA